MDINKIPDSKWNDLVLGKSNYEFKFLATKILLSRLQRQATNDPANLQKYSRELRELFSKNINLPSVQSDLKLIAGKED